MDKRTYELTDAGTYYQTDSDNWGTVIDNQNTGDAKFLKFGTLFKKDRVVSTDLTNNYKALTPRSLLLSTATETELGVTKLATDAEVLAISGSDAIQASQIGLMYNAISSTGSMQNWWMLSVSYPIEDADCSNIYYCGLSNIVHLNGYLIFKLYPITLVEIDFSVIGPPIAGSVASVNAYWAGIDNNTPTKLISYAQNINGNLRLSFKNQEPFGDNGNYNIYFQVTYVTAIN